MLGKSPLISPFDHVAVYFSFSENQGFFRQFSEFSSVTFSKCSSYSTSLEPKVEPQVDPQVEPRLKVVEPQLDPQVEPQLDPQVEPRLKVVEPQVDPLVEPKLKVVERNLEPQVESAENRGYALVAKNKVLEAEQESAKEVPLSEQKSLRVALIGIPNSGKSTLINQLLGQKVRNIRCCFSLKEIYAILLVQFV